METQISPTHSKIHLHDGVVLIRHEVFGPFDTRIAGNLERAARSYQRKRNSYQRAAKALRSEDIIQRIVGGLILHFTDGEESFLPRRVLVWAAFADEDLRLDQVHSALSKLKPIVELVGHSYWKVNRKKMRRFLES